MRKITLVVGLVGAALVLACVSPTPALSSFPARAGAVWSEDCCGRPIEKKAPEYPPDAQRKSLTGWVVVSGILDERGWVTDPVVLAADPPGVFDDAAVKAFDSWRYAVPASDSAARREVREVIPFRTERPHSAPSGSIGGGGGGGGMSGGGGGY
jgi:TonB family protein